MKVLEYGEDTVNKCRCEYCHSLFEYLPSETRVVVGGNLLVETRDVYVSCPVCGKENQVRADIAPKRHCFGGRYY